MTSSRVQAAERWRRRLWDLMTDIEVVEGEDMDSDLHQLVRLAWKESRREVTAMEGRANAGWDR